MPLQLQLRFQVWEVFAFKDSGHHLDSKDRTVDRLTPYYTPVQAIGTEMRQTAIRQFPHRARGEPLSARRPRLGPWRPLACWHPAAGRESGARSAVRAGNGRKARCRKAPGKAPTRPRI